MPLLTSTPSGLRVDRASETFSGWIPPAKSQPYLLLMFGSFNWSQLNALPLQRCLISSMILTCRGKRRLSNKQMDIKLYKIYAFTCHPLHCLQGPNQLENTLHQKLCLKGFHPHLHGEHILHDFPELRTEKLTENHVHEAALSKYNKIKHLIVMEHTLTLGQKLPEQIQGLLHQKLLELFQNHHPQIHPQALLHNLLQLSISPVQQKAKQNVLS